MTLVLGKQGRLLSLLSVVVIVVVMQFTNEVLVGYS